MVAKGIASLMLPLVTLFVLILMPGSNNGQFLDQGSCVLTKSLFISQGCVNNDKDLICRLLALRLTFKVNNKPLCNFFPCEGYNQRGNSQCRRRLIGGCPMQNIDRNGICGGYNVCCRM